MNQFEYKTIDSEIYDMLLKIKGSKFYGLIFYVTHEEEIKEKLLFTRNLYPQATHYCYAYRIGINGEFYKANDNGEPSGTAGLPIYNQLLSSELTNVLLIVVRYFGGTKLGVSGLIKAYKETAQETLAVCKIVTKELTSVFILKFDYQHQSSIMNLLKKSNAEIIKSDFSEKINLQISILQKNEEAYLEKCKPFLDQKFMIQSKAS